MLLLATKTRGNVEQALSRFMEMAAASVSHTHTHTHAYTLTLPPSLPPFFFFFFFDNSLEVLHTYNKRATETRHCIHMLGYHMGVSSCGTQHKHTDYQ